MKSYILRIILSTFLLCVATVFIWKHKYGERYTITYNISALMKKKGSFGYLKGLNKSEAKTNAISLQSTSEKPPVSSRWVVVALAVSHDMKLEYAFCLPFTVAAWKRVGWDVTVLVFWKHNSLEVFSCSSLG